MDLGLKIISNQTYDYQEALSRGYCGYCSESLVWELNKNSQVDDDRFCVANCYCGRKFYMVAERVTIKLGEIK